MIAFLIGLVIGIIAGILIGRRFPTVSDEVAIAEQAVAAKVRKTASRK